MLVWYLITLFLHPAGAFTVRTNSLKYSFVKELTPDNHRVEFYLQAEDESRLVLNNVPSKKGTIYEFGKGRLVKGQVASISSKSATNFFFDYWRSSSSKPTPSIYIDINMHIYYVTSHSEASHRINKPFRRFLLVTAASLTFRPPAL